MHPSIKKNFVPPETANQPLTIPEVLFVFVGTYVLAGVGLSALLEHFLSIHVQFIRGWESHIPMFVIPYIWYKRRVAHSFHLSDRPIFMWRKSKERLFLKLLLWFVPFVLLLNVSAFETSFSTAFGSFASAVSAVLFQSVFVGLSEEMMIRPAIQLPLSFILKGRFTFGRFTLSHANLITAALFGGMHMLNLIYQPLIQTILQSVYACFLAVLIGYYYERTRNYLGAAIIHGINNGLPLLLIGIHSLIANSLA